MFKPKENCDVQLVLRIWYDKRTECANVYIDYQRERNYNWISRDGSVRFRSAGGPQMNNFSPSRFDVFVRGRNSELDTNLCIARCSETYFVRTIAHARQVIAREIAGQVVILGKEGSSDIPGLVAPPEPEPVEAIDGLRWGVINFDEMARAVRGIRANGIAADEWRIEI